ncbi:hypothetical protein JHK87_043524 [Glycine soja]|nr:hypothetical protein JHK87_043524 [Glycine soja]
MVFWCAWMRAIAFCTFQLLLGLSLCLLEWPIRNVIKLHLGMHSLFCLWNDQSGRSKNILKRV